jgi:hypothetical protein
MRKFTVMLLVALLVGGLAIVGLAGCGTTAVKVGNSEVQTKNGQTTIKTPTGETTVSSRIPTEAELGVPVYPNAKMDENASMAITNSKGQKEYTVAKLWTDDSTDTVIAWYKGQLSGRPEYKEMPLTEGGVNEMIFAWKEGDKYKMVTVGPGKVDHPGKTIIAVGAGTPGTGATGQ